MTHDNLRSRKWVNHLTATMMDVYGRQRSITCCADNCQNRQS